MEQLTIFDWLPEQIYPDINETKEEDAVRMVGDALGVVFRYDYFQERWRAKKGRFRMGLEYDHFNLEHDKSLFLGADWELGTSGGGSPCRGIGHAIEYLRRKYEQETGKREPGADRAAV